MSAFVWVRVSLKKWKRRGVQVSGSSGSRKFSFIHSSGIVPNSNFGVYGTSLSRPSTPSSTLSPTNQTRNTHTQTLCDRDRNSTRAKKRKPMQQHRSLLCDVFEPIKIITFKLCSLTNSTHTKKVHCCYTTVFVCVRRFSRSTRTHTHCQYCDRLVYNQSYRSMNFLLRSCSGNTPAKVFRHFFLLFLSLF